MPLPGHFYFATGFRGDRGLGGALGLGGAVGLGGAFGAAGLASAFGFSATGAAMDASVPAGTTSTLGSDSTLYGAATGDCTGSFPNKGDVLMDGSYIEVFNKYYRFTVTTNDSGDFMIFGVPVGTQTIVMDIDLSDIGCFSLSPQDLIQQG